MGKARIVSGGSGGLYTIEVKYDTTRIDARLADIAATLPVIQAELDALDAQLTTSRTELTAAVAAMNDQINLINANKPFDGAYIDGLIGDMQAATSDIENKNIQIDDAYQTLTGYEAAIDAATQDETAKRAAYQQAQATLSAYVAETGDTSSGYYLSQVADVENKLAAYQTAQQITVDTKSVFEPQIATQKAEIAQLKNELKILQDQYKSVNAEFVAVTQAMEAWSKQDQGAIDEAGKVAIQANAKYVLTKFKRDDKKREVIELTQEQKWLNKAKAQSSETRDAWCVDRTTTMAVDTEVGTIEIAQEQADIPMMIRAGYSPGGTNSAIYNASIDGALQKLPNMSPESAWLNMSLYPALAKWKPMYRRGTLTAKSGSMGTVLLDATYASATQIPGGVKRIGVNQSPTVLTDVPIFYMTCDGAAFSVGDRVVVEFQGRDWNQPKVIGFVDHPKPCPTSPPYVSWPSQFDIRSLFTLEGAATDGPEYWSLMNTVSRKPPTHSWSSITQDNSSISSDGAWVKYTWSDTWDDGNNVVTQDNVYYSVPNDIRDRTRIPYPPGAWDEFHYAAIRGTSVSAITCQHEKAIDSEFTYDTSVFDFTLNISRFAVGDGGYITKTRLRDNEAGTALVEDTFTTLSQVVTVPPFSSLLVGGPLLSPTAYTEYDLPPNNIVFTVTHVATGKTRYYKAIRAKVTHDNFNNYPGITTDDLMVAIAPDRTGEAAVNDYWYKHRYFYKYTAWLQPE